MTVREVAELPKLNQQTIRNWIDDGKLPAVRAGNRRVRIREADVDAFIAASSGQAPPAPVDRPWGRLHGALAAATSATAGEDLTKLVEALTELSEAARELAARLAEGVDGA